jgi:3-hydroxybutyrate dehydrogenase
MHVHRCPEFPLPAPSPAIVIEVDVGGQEVSYILRAQASLIQLTNHVLKYRFRAAINHGESAVFGLKYGDTNHVGCVQMECVNLVKHGPSSPRVPTASTPGTPATESADASVGEHSTRASAPRWDLCDLWDLCEVRPHKSHVSHRSHSVAGPPAVTTPRHAHTLQTPGVSTCLSLSTTKDSEMDFSTKTVLVTGAGSGIGRAIAETFARRKARVFLHDINPAAAELAGKIGAEFLPGDLNNRDAVRALASTALEKSGGRIDILVNNAGFQHVAQVEEFPEEVWTSMIQVMLVAPFQLIRALLPAMKQNSWGRIINVASIHAVVASPFKSAYISAKHGLLGLTRCVALETAPFGVTVNAICPAYVRTPLVEKQIADQARAHGLTPDDVIEKIMLEPAAIKRLIEPGEIADFVTFLCSEPGAIITGSAQMLDLGWTAR